MRTPVSPRPARFVSPARLGVIALIGVAAALLSGCRSAEVEVQRPIRLGKAPTYAWTTSPPATDETLLRARNALDRALRERGLNPAPAGEARLEARVAVATGVRTRNYDPYFSHYLLDEVEEGTLVLSLHEPTTGRSLWRAESTAVLRVLRRGQGWTRVRMEETGEERTWPLEELAAAIADRLVEGQQDLVRR